MYLPDSIDEMAHLYTWRYSSHTLRESLADYVAMQILPGAGLGPNIGGHDRSMKIPSDIIDLLGSSRFPPEWVSSDIARRTAYYSASFRFVKYLVERQGLAVFMKLYDSDDPEQDYVSLYGAAREELARLAMM